MKAAMVVSSENKWNKSNHDPRQYNNFFPSMLLMVSMGLEVIVMKSSVVMVKRYIVLIMADGRFSAGLLLLLEPLSHRCESYTCKIHAGHVEL